MRPRVLVLVLGLLVLGAGLLILLVPKTVQTGNPVLGQLREEDFTEQYSCGSPLTYAFGSRPWEEDNPDTYQNNRFVPVSTVCPNWLQSNLRAGLLWSAIGVGIIVALQVVTRRMKKQAAPRQPSPAPPGR